MDPRLSLGQICDCFNVFADSEKTRYSKSPFEQHFLDLLVLPLERTFLTCSAPNLLVEFSSGDVKHVNQ